MARVVATFTAVFLIGPIFVPFVGEAILLVGSWRTVFLVGVLLAVVAFVWTLRFGETMAVEHRRPIRFRPFAEAFSSVLRTPVTFWALVGSTLFTASTGSTTLRICWCEISLSQIDCGLSDLRRT